MSQSSIDNKLMFKQKTWSAKKKKLRTIDRNLKKKKHCAKNYVF